MSINLSVKDLFDQLFGEGQAFEPQFNGVRGNVPGKRNEAGTIGNSPYYAIDAELGREYFLPVTIYYPEDTTASDPLTGGTKAGVLKSWDLPNPTVSVTCKKIIVETPLTERRGTVKELINIQDYEIRIKGTIVIKANEFPEAQVIMLMRLFEMPVVVGISNAITDIFLLRTGRHGSDKVVIKEFVLPEMRGVKNVRHYELVLISDEPFSLVELV